MKVKQAGMVIVEVLSTGRDYVRKRKTILYGNTAKYNMVD